MREPLCSYFGSCGGCSLQHLEYETQLENKRRQVAQALRYDDIKVFSGREYNYRNRMDFIFHPGGLGLREKRHWNRIIDIDVCRISDQKLNLILGEIRSFFRSCDYLDIQKHSGTFHYAVIRAPQEDSSVSFVLNDKSTRIAEAVEKIREFAKATIARNVVVTYAPPNSEASVSDDFFVVKGTDMLKESYLGMVFWYSVQGFFQNNHDMAEKMISYSNEILRRYPTDGADLLDLYGGVGAFGLVNSPLFRSVTIVESVAQSIAAANRNIAENSIGNTRAVLMDAASLKKLDVQRPLYVITDPPRSGMHPKTIKRLNELMPSAIIYISCNLAQLAKDISKFPGYSIRSAALFDLFPQTPHCETVVELAPETPL